MSGLDAEKNLESTAPREKVPKSTSVRIIVRNEKGQILLVLERPHEVFLAGGKNDFQKPWGWGLPGGRLKRRADGTLRETREHAVDRELKQEAKHVVSSKYIAAKIVDKEKNHEIIIFEGQDPRPCRTTQEEPDIADVGWFDPRIIYGSAENPLRVELFSAKFGKKFPVYRRHVNWIQGSFKK
jgi:ADP-ribose pyrophosphatase YjhB (NUDIX family)